MPYSKYVKVCACMYYVCTCLNTVCTVPWDSFHEIGFLAFHSVQHLCVGLENLLGQLINQVCALTALVCSMYIVCTYIAYTLSYCVYTVYVHVYALHMGTM